MSKLHPNYHALPFITQDSAVHFVVDISAWRAAVRHSYTNTFIYRPA